MMETRKLTENKIPRKIPAAAWDLVVLAVCIITVFILSYFFNVFSLLVEMAKNHPSLTAYVDEALSVSLTIIVGLAIIAWRRWREFVKSNIEREQLQEEVLLLAKTKSDTERIIARQLRDELEYHKRVEEKILHLAREQQRPGRSFSSRRPKNREASEDRSSGGGQNSGD